VRPEDDQPLSFMEHVDELRKRLRNAVFAALVGMVASYAYAAEIYEWLVGSVLVALPEGGKKLYFSNPVDPIFLFLKVAALAGLFLAAPVILYQVWAFVAPGLYRRERRLVAPFIVVGTLFFLGGAAFAHWLVLPYAFEYMIASYSSPLFAPLLDMSEVLGLVITLHLAMGLIFELPLLLTLLARLGLVTSTFLARYRRWAIVVNLVVAAVITPTGDPFNLALMAGPLIVCYEVGVLGARLVERPGTDSSAGVAAATG
jgi:sec-independent protein translocase protein TatC